MPDNNQGATPSQKVLEKVTAENITVGDISQNIQNIFSSADKDVDFFEPNLKPFRPPEFPTPRLASDLLFTLREKNIVVLGEGVNVDKSALARHLAVLQSKHLSTLDKEVIIKEWYRSSDPSSIKYELEVSKTCKILILTQATPQHLLGYNLSDIQYIASKRTHFIIVTTELPFAAWHLFDSCRAWWHEINEKDVKDCQRLINELSQEEALSKWYYEQLDSREQLLAIGLSLFDGLFDDQFFAALETVVECSWKNRDANLQSLDYCDLDNLRGYFDLIETKSQQSIVKIRYPKQRLTCLKIAWKSHRRQILSVLPILTKLVKGTAEGVRRELYSSQIRKDKLCQTISEAISGIGIISRLYAGSREAVEESLIQLAASKDPQVQAVAAQSIAAWRDRDSQSFYIDNQRGIDIDRELFFLLESWQKEFQERAKSLGEAEAEEGNAYQGKQENTADYIRATLAIVVGYASQYDPKGKLSEDLYERFKELAFDSNPLVRKSFERYTLTQVVGRHLSKVQNFLLKMILDDDSANSKIPAVSESLSQAYRYDPASVVSLLKEWQHLCLKEDVFLDNKEGRRKIRSLVYITALTIENIFDKNHDRYSEELTVKQAFVMLLEFLKFEQSHPTREKILSLISSLVKKKFNEFEPQHLEELFRIISLRESNEIILNTLNEIYLKQRSQLTNGDKVIVIGNNPNNKYPVWFSPEERKTTLIEGFLLSWIKEKHNPRLQKVAALSFMGFVKDFEDKEKKEIDFLKKKRSYVIPLTEDNQAIHKLSRQPFFPKHPKEKLYISKIIPWLVTRKSKIYFKNISHILPETAKYRLPWSSAVNFFLGKLKNGNNEELKKISQLIRRGMWISPILYPVYILFLVLPLLLASRATVWYFVRDPSASSRSVSSGQPEIEVLNQSGAQDGVADFSENPFAQLSYPLDECGDPQPTDPSLYPVNIYPVFIAHSDTSLRWAKSSMCRDSFVKTRKEVGQVSIQVASFLTYERANLFKEFIGAGFPDAEIGKPSIFDMPPNSSEPVIIRGKGAIQLPVDANKTLIEANLPPFTLDRHTFKATSKKTVIAMRASFGRVSLLITDPNGESLSVIVDPEDNSVMSWAEELPLDGTYTVDTFSQTEKASYRLFLQIEP